MRRIPVFCHGTLIRGRVGATRTRGLGIRHSRVRWVLVGALAVLLAGTGAVVADVVGTAERPLEFQLISRATAINNFVLQDPTRFTVGDRYVFSDQVLRPSAPTTPVGKFEGQCTLIDPAAGVRTSEYDKRCGPSNGPNSTVPSPRALR